MKKLVLLIYFVGYPFILKAQDSSVDETLNELLPAMSTTQRAALKPFESLQIIDTDDNNIWIYKNTKWQRVFSDEDILKAKKNRTGLLNKSESWKEFDEISRPQTESSEKALSESVENVQAMPISKPNTMRYMVMTPGEITNSTIHLELNKTEKLAYIKIHGSNAASLDIVGFKHLTKDQYNAVLIQPLKLESQISSFSIVNKISKSMVTDLSPIKGILIAFQVAD